MRFLDKTIGLLVAATALLLRAAAAYSGEWQHHPAPWVGAAFPYNSPNVALVVIPDEGLLATANGGAYISRDDGANWTEIDVPGDDLVHIVNTRERPDTLYAANVTVRSQGSHNRVDILESLDAGRTWTRLASDTFCMRLALDPTGRPAYCFDLNYSSAFVPTVMRSRDGGSTWSQVDVERLGTLAGVNAIALTPWTVLVSNGAAIKYLSLLRQDDEWRDAAWGPWSVTTPMAVDPTYQARVYVGSGQGLFASRDAGRSWHHVAFPFELSAVAIDPFDAAVYVAFHGGVARSRDGGATWESVSAGLSDQRISFIEFSERNVYIVTDQGLSVCHDKACTDPLLPLADNVVEFYHAGLDHYFYTANLGEQAWLDAGGAGGGWLRTGSTFRNSGSRRVCRFYGSVDPGPNSHFYTSAPEECQGLKDLQAATPATEKRWNYEGLDFFSGQSPIGTEADRYCAEGTTPVYRAYNNGYERGIDSNHRLSTDREAIRALVVDGWIDEGIMMCAPE